MSLIEAVVLGIVQGITEFLPISSTAHLRIAPALLGWDDPGAAYSAVIQLGTVAAVIIYFWKDLVRLAIAFFAGLRARQPFGTVEAKLAWFVIVGSIPAGVLGFVLKDFIENQFRSLYIISSSLIGLAILLFIAERVASHRRTLAEMTWRDGVIIGFWQALALVPGSSRSGSTITGGLFQGLKREDAARYSFLLSVPITAAAGLFELKHLLEATQKPQTVALVVGTVVSFIAGMAAIAGLLKFLRTRTNMVFVVYRIALGVTLLGMLQTGRLQPATGVVVHEQQAPPKTTD